jgi:hypothetical protein
MNERFDLRSARIYKGESGPLFRMGAKAWRERPADVFAVTKNLCDGMIGKAVKIRHCPATVSVSSCVR